MTTAADRHFHKAILTATTTNYYDNSNDYSNNDDQNQATIIREGWPRKHGGYKYFVLALLLRLRPTHAASAVASTTKTIDMSTATGDDDYCYGCCRFM